MSAYLLDSTVIIDHVNDLGSAAQLLETLFADGADLLTCDAITCEVLSGGTDEQRLAIMRLLDVLEYVATDPVAARWAGDGRRARAKGGNARSLGDALIAAVAWRNDATVVTRNPRDFEGRGFPSSAIEPLASRHEHRHRLPRAHRAAQRKLQWREWSGYFAASVYADHHDIEYNAIREAVALIDVTPLFKYRVSGPDAERLVDRVITRDATKLMPGQRLLHAVVRRARPRRGRRHGLPARRRLVPLDRRRSQLRWFRQNARGLDVEIEEISEAWPPSRSRGRCRASCWRPRPGRPSRTSATSAAGRRRSAGSSWTSAAPVTPATSATSCGSPPTGRSTSGMR